jgi:hypothetical protein
MIPEQWFLVRYQKRMQMSHRCHKTGLFNKESNLTRKLLIRLRADDYILCILYFIGCT